MERNEVRNCIKKYLWDNNVTKLTEGIDDRIKESLSMKYGRLCEIDVFYKDFFRDTEVIGSIKRCDPIEKDFVIECIDFEINESLEVMVYDSKCFPLTLDMDNLSEDDLIDINHIDASRIDVYTTFMRIEPSNRGRLAAMINNCLGCFVYDIPPYAFYKYDGTFLHRSNQAVGDIAEINETVVSIGNHAFDGCTNLKEVFIKSNSLIYIGKKAFTNIPGLIIHCSVPIKPETWSDEWCDENCKVIWGK